MTKRKNSKQGPSNPASPTNKGPPAPLPITSSTRIIVDQPGLSEEAKKDCDHTQYPTIPHQNPPSSFSDPNFTKIQTIADELRPYLQTEWDDKMTKKITKPQIYCILHHFNPETKSRPSNLKDSLIASFEKDVKPLIKPHFIVFQNPAGEAMETEQSGNIDPDFDPLSSKTTCQMLRNAIERKEPSVDIPKTARRDWLLWLYKAYVDRDIVIPKDSRWTSRPRVLGVDRLKRETIEDLRFALQVYAPQVFVHSVAMVHPVMVSLYLEFIRGEPETVARRAVEGFHYSIIQ
ncbi:hypothetical protein DFH28DRAFT_909545 [Melampsora americana]|nr:hypothetical protein DFH28DRAFT_909545 [Melampsora americana]